MYKHMKLYLLLLMLTFVTVATYAYEFDFSSLQKSVVEATLNNGLKIIILPRHDAPVVSVVTWANVGGTDDPKGYSGLAHMFEHMAFKGTDTIGTTNSEKELELMAKEDETFEKYRLERLKGERADKILLEKLREDFDNAVAEAYKVVIPNEFCNLLENEGANGLNAYTTSDQTAYIMTLPSNKLELWIALESERFLHPRLREMYKEREVINEERRMSVENVPLRRLIEEMLCVAFIGHPYGTPLIGYASDIQNYSRSVAKRFFEKYYGPDNLTIAIVGDVEPHKAINLIDKYFGPIAPRGVPERIATIEPEQNSERRVKLFDASNNILVMGWHVPEATHEDTPALNALNTILGGGETSRLHRRLVRDEKISVSTFSASGWPGNKYPNLSVVFCYPAPNKTTDECEKVVLEEIEKLKKELVSKEELNRVKTRVMASMVMGLRDNLDMAEALAKYQQIWGDWRELFNESKRINSVTPNDIKRVANKYFNEKGRTVATIEQVNTSNETAKEGKAE